VRYIDAGYAVALTVLAGYGAALWRRLRRLERTVHRPVKSPGP